MQATRLIFFIPQTAQPEFLEPPVLRALAPMTLLREPP
jgi:hypothetical protein